jgi:hypothetical protein
VSLSLGVRTFSSFTLNLHPHTVFCGTPSAHTGLTPFSSFTHNLHTHTALLGAPLAQCSCDCLYSRKIKKCECEFECEDIFFLHTQSTPSHCPPRCASGAMILRPFNYQGFWWYSLTFLLLISKRMQCSISFTGHIRFRLTSNPLIIN